MIRIRLAAVFLLAILLPACPVNRSVPKKGSEKKSGKKSSSKPRPRTVLLTVEQEGLEGDLDWDGIVSKIMDACDGASTEKILYRPPDLSQSLSVHLRWNAPASKCRITLSRIFLGYDGKAVKALSDRIRALQPGPKSVEIDAAGDVPMMTVIDVLSLLRQAGIPHIYFKSGPSMDRHPALMRVRKLGLTNEQGTFVPDVTVKVDVNPLTRFVGIRNILSLCAYIGIHKIYLGLDAGTMIKAFLPVGHDLGSGD